MENNCARCEARRIQQESLSDKGPREINQNLLADLFDLTYFLYGEFRGNYSSISSDRYVNRARVLEVVNSAIDKAEMQAVDAWRSNQRKKREEEEDRHTHSED